ncbi:MULTISPECIES: hypothetical protein [Ensifer]|jgi:hypothetical protein|uniref:hypothetical protein n=1 Tax=Ensifer TaxID=106591 RepID=UPI000B225034|nr:MULTISPECIES: hypothetical protein [Ensifer]NOV16980.1 hypothetical protein [Ensifer canadensis]
MVRLGRFLVFLTANTWWLPAARSEGRELERSAQLGRSREIIKERNRTNAAVNSLSDADLCHELGGIWVLADKRRD